MSPFEKEILIKLLALAITEGVKLSTVFLEAREQTEVTDEQWASMVAGVKASGDELEAALRRREEELGSG